MRNLDGQLITVLGGGGFIGRYVVQKLLARGARVRIAEREPRKALFLKPLGGLGQIQFVAADVRKPETIARAVAGTDAVVNLAGSFSDLDGVVAGGARAVAEAAASAGVSRLVHISAIGADPESPAAYGRAKAAGEAAVRAAFPAATILRPATVFGREDAFVNRFAAMVARTPVVPVLRSGARFQPVYVVDVAQAVKAALGDAAAGQTLELGGPDVLTMGALIRWIAGAIGRDPAILELPDIVGGLIAMGGFLPGAPITRDQWRMLQRDTVVTGVDGLATLGITPTPMDAVAPGWLVRYRRHGRFGTHAAA